MNTSELLDRTRGVFGVQGVFGTPIQSGETLVVPVAKIQGGAGGGEGTAETPGVGMGFGLIAKPAGAFVIRHERLSWRPAVDVNRIILGAQIVAATALIAFASVARKTFLLEAVRRRRRGIFGRRRR